MLGLIFVFLYYTLEIYWFQTSLCTYHPIAKCQCNAKCSMDSGKNQPCVPLPLLCFYRHIQLFHLRIYKNLIFDNVYV